jgi:hypothetical protein
MQRSGTNMLMDVLERSRVTDVYHETDPRAFANYEMRELALIKRLVRKSPAPRVIIKALCELNSLRRLMGEFTPAKAVWIVRDYNDAVNSALVSFRNFAPQVSRIAQDRNSDDWRGRGMSDETHALVRKLYHPEMNEASAAAMQWYFRNILYFEQELDADPRVMLVSYESLVSEPQTCFPSIFQFLDMEYSPWISAKVFASSIRRRPQPEIDPAVRATCDALTQRLKAVFDRKG